MEKIVVRENIKFSVLKGCDLETVIQDIKKVYKDDCPHRTTISRWYHYFKSGGDRTEDSPWSGRPVQPVNPRLIKMISDLIQEDWRISQSMIDVLTDESKGYIDHVIREHTDFIRVIASGYLRCWMMIRKELGRSTARICWVSLRTIGTIWSII